MSLQDRDALYYPYIKIQNPNWLKATLLAFPQVRRMVPEKVEIEDSPEVAQFSNLTGAKGKPLLVKESTTQQAVYEAQRSLASRLVEYEDYLIENYSRDHTYQQFGKHGDDFKVHKGKMHGVLHFLEDRNLTWSPAGDKWYAMHPRVGEAVMSTVAISIATDKGLDVVTHGDRAHLAVVSQDEDGVLRELLSREIDLRRSESVDADELTQFFMTNAIDVSRLTPEDIAELAKEGKDLRQFRAEVATIAEKIPDIRNPEERQVRLEEASQEIVEKWNNYKQSLPRFALDAILDASQIKAPEIITGLVAETTVANATLGVGLLLGFIVFSGIRVWRSFKDKTTSPYSYLSKIGNRGASIII